MVSFEASLYSVPAAAIRAGQRVEVRATSDLVAIHAVGGDLLAIHPRAGRHGSWVIDESHWDGLPDGHTRAVVVEPHTLTSPQPAEHSDPTGRPNPLTALLANHPAATDRITVRDLTVYEQAAGILPATAPEPTPDKENRP